MCHNIAKEGNMYTQEGIFYNSKGEPRPYRLAFPEKPSKAAKPYPLAVFAHGFGGSYDSSYIVNNVPYFMDVGVATMTFNFCNDHRDKICTKNLTPNNALDDLNSGVRFITQDSRIDTDNMIGVGASFGAFTMLRYAADKDNPPLKGMILYSAVPDPVAPFKKELNPVKEMMWRWKEHIQVDVDGERCPIAYKCYKELTQIDMFRDVAPNITCRVVNIHGDQDRLAPVADIEALRNAMSHTRDEDKHIFPGVGHAFPVERADPEKPSPMERAVAITQKSVREFLAENSQSLTWSEQIIAAGVYGYGLVKNAMGLARTVPPKTGTQRRAVIH